jgi:hypothetical protein
VPHAFGGVQIISGAVRTPPPRTPQKIRACNNLSLLGGKSDKILHIDRYYEFGLYYCVHITYV